MSQTQDSDRCWCVLGESAWCPVHHPELADATDQEKAAEQLAWDIRDNGPLPEHIARRGRS